MVTDTQLIISRFAHGDCYIMAVALSERFGGKIGSLIVDISNSRSANGRWPHPVHAYLLLADGDILDAKGKRPLDSIHEEFLATTNRKFWKPRFVEFNSIDDFLMDLRVMEEGPNSEGLPFALESFDYTWRYLEHFNKMFPDAQRAIETLELETLLERPFQPTF